MPKSSRSPLYFYADAYRRTHRQRMNINEAIAACYDEWKALSDEEKQPYKNLYEQWRLESRLNPQPNAQQQTRMSEEISLSQRDIPCEDFRRHYDRFNLEKHFLAYEYLPLDRNELLTMPIYIMNFQIFCRVDEEDGGAFLPAEMCILRYTLMDGVTLYRQRFLKPERIPTGYTSSCLEHAQETHQIPLKDFPEASDNYRQIYQELKSFLQLTMINQSNLSANHDDDRIRRRYRRLTQPCVFFPAMEYEQTKGLMDLLQEKAEGIKPTEETRFVNLASLESLVMVLAELKEHRVSRDDIQRTFENAAYSFLIEQRCPYHMQIGTSHCSLARCHAGAKLISAYLNQLYVPARSASASKSQWEYNDNASAFNSTTHMPPSVTARPTSVSHQSNEINDSIASSYRPSEQRKQASEDPITELQRRHFHRLLSTADSTRDEIDQHRTILIHRKRMLLDALQDIDRQIDELDLQ